MQHQASNMSITTTITMVSHSMQNQATNWVLSFLLGFDAFRYRLAGLQEGRVCSSGCPGLLPCQQLSLCQRTFHLIHGVFRGFCRFFFEPSSFRCHLFFDKQRQRKSWEGTDKERGTKQSTRQESSKAEHRKRKEQGWAQERKGAKQDRKWKSKAEHRKERSKVAHKKGEGAEERRRREAQRRSRESREKEQRRSRDGAEEEQRRNKGGQEKDMEAWSYSLIGAPHPSRWHGNMSPILGFGTQHRRFNRISREKVRMAGPFLVTCFHVTVPGYGPRHWRFNRLEKVRSAILD